MEEQNLMLDVRKQNMFIERDILHWKSSSRAQLKILYMFATILGWNG